jgi:hypothetical protein
MCHRLYNSLPTRLSSETARFNHTAQQLGNQHGSPEHPVVPLDRFPGIMLQCISPVLGTWVPGCRSNRKITPSLRFNTSKPNHVAPLLGFRHDELAEFGRG